ncbi:MAG TPA: hypothetical protein VFM54_14640 [Micromonosporaceae bacterium]|nr:hypothetical protein [Micromonosporaceae bacterium]
MAGRSHGYLPGCLGGAQEQPAAQQGLGGGEPVGYRPALGVQDTDPAGELGLGAVDQLVQVLQLGGLHRGGQGGHVGGGEGVQHCAELAQ